VVETLAKLDRAFDELRFDDMADAIYHFVWGTFCDWYVELVKGAFDEETKRVAAWAFDQILVMLHPLMPFITEELWSANERPYELIVAKWPEPQAQVDPHAKREIDGVIKLIEQVRTARADLNVPPSVMLDLYDSGETGAWRHHWLSVSRLARLKLPTELPSESDRRVAIHVSVSGTELFIPLRDAIDVEAEKARLDKAAIAAEKDRDSLAQRLANPNFAERAKPEAVEKARADHEAKAAEAERLRAALERLG